MGMAAWDNKGVILLGFHQNHEEIKKSFGLIPLRERNLLQTIRHRKV